jgi:DNA-binding SARP family transcriptional activator
MKFSLALFGGPELRDPTGQIVKPASRKDMALLAYLALQRRPAQREKLAGLLWPDRSEAQARKSLRQSLVVLRRLFGERQVILTRGAGDISLDASQLDIDVVQFTEAALLGAGILPEQLSQTLLDGYDGLTPEYDDWLALERRRLSDLAVNRLTQHCQTLLDQTDWAEAVASARRITELSPYHEEGRRLLMRALDGAGERAQALQEFHSFSGLLRNELDVSPDQSTAALYRSLRGTSPAVPREKCATGLIAQRPSIPRPALIVLPFRVEGEAGQSSSLSAGLSEELIATLAAYRWFSVMSCLQASIYGRTPVSPKRLREELGVDYVLTGSVRQRGRKLFAKLELASAHTSEHLWSDKFETYLDETLIALDEFAASAAARIEPEMVKAEVGLRTRAPERNFDAWLQLMRARQLADTCQAPLVSDAVGMIAHVLQDVSESALAQGTFAYATWLDHVFSAKPQASIEQGMAAAERAIGLDPNFYLGHFGLGVFQNGRRELDRAAPNLRRAIDTNPSFPVSYNQLTMCLSLDGRPAEALQWASRLQDISPNDPMRGFYGCVRAVAHYLLGNYDASVENGRISLADHPVWLISELVTCAGLHRTGLMAEAYDQSDTLIRQHGHQTIDQVRNVFRLRREADLQMVLEPLSDLGVIT